MFRTAPLPDSDSSVGGAWWLSGPNTYTALSSLNQIVHHNSKYYFLAYNRQRFSIADSLTPLGGRLLFTPEGDLSGALGETLYSAAVVNNNFYYTTNFQYLWYAPTTPNSVEKRIGRITDDNNRNYEWGALFAIDNELYMIARDKDADLTQNDAVFIPSYLPFTPNVLLRINPSTGAATRLATGSPNFDKGIYHYTLAVHEGVVFLVDTKSKTNDIFVVDLENLTLQKAYTSDVDGTLFALGVNSSNGEMIGATIPDDLQIGVYRFGFTVPTNQLATIINLKDWVKQKPLDYEEDDNLHERDWVIVQKNTGGR